MRCAFAVCLAPRIGSHTLLVRVVRAAAWLPLRAVRAVRATPGCRLDTRALRALPRPTVLPRPMLPRCLVIWVPSYPVGCCVARILPPLLPVAVHTLPSRCLYRSSLVWLRGLVITFTCCLRGLCRIAFPTPTRVPRAFRLTLFTFAAVAPYFAGLRTPRLLVWLLPGPHTRTLFCWRATHGFLVTTRFFAPLLHACHARTATPDYALRVVPPFLWVTAHTSALPLHYAPRFGFLLRFTLRLDSSHTFSSGWTRLPHTGFVCVHTVPHALDCPPRTALVLYAPHAGFTRICRCIPAQRFARISLRLPVAVYAARWIHYRCQVIAFILAALRATTFGSCLCMVHHGSGSAAVPFVRCTLPLVCLLVLPFTFGLPGSYAGSGSWFLPLWLPWITVALVGLPHIAALPLPPPLFGLPLCSWIAHLPLLGWITLPGLLVALPVWVPALCRATCVAALRPPDIPSDSLRPRVTGLPWFTLRGLRRLTRLYLRHTIHACYLDSVPVCCRLPWVSSARRGLRAVPCRFGSPRLCQVTDYAFTTLPLVLVLVGLRLTFTLRTFWHLFNTLGLPTTLVATCYLGFIPTLYTPSHFAVTPMVCTICPYLTRRTLRSWVHGLPFAPRFWLPAGLYRWHFTLPHFARFTTWIRYRWRFTPFHAALPGLPVNAVIPHAPPLPAPVGLVPFHMPFLDSYAVAPRLLGAGCACLPLDCAFLPRLPLRCSCTALPHRLPPRIAAACLVYADLPTPLLPCTCTHAFQLGYCCLLLRGLYLPITWFATQFFYYIPLVLLPWLVLRCLACLPSCWFLPYCLCTLDMVLPSHCLARLVILRLCRIRMPAQFPRTLPCRIRFQVPIAWFNAFACRAGYAALCPVNARAVVRGAVPGCAAARIAIPPCYTTLPLLQFPVWISTFFGLPRLTPLVRVCPGCTPFTPDYALRCAHGGFTPRMGYARLRAFTGLPHVAHIAGLPTASSAGRHTRRCTCLTFTVAAPCSPLLVAAPAPLRIAGSSFTSPHTCCTLPLAVAFPVRPCRVPQHALDDRTWVRARLHFTHGFAFCTLLDYGCLVLAWLQRVRLVPIAAPSGSMHPLLHAHTFGSLPYWSCRMPHCLGCPFADTRGAVVPDCAPFARCGF